MDSLTLLKSNCKNCHKCIRYCPVKAISFKDNQANIIQNECILCGECFVVCPQNAKSIRNDLPAVKKLLKSGSPVYVSLAPSFFANYEGIGIEAMSNALKKLGFAGAEETALGATAVKDHYDDMVDSGDMNVIISSCCHTVNLLIQRYYPSVLPNLAKVPSPMLAHGAMIKQRDPDAKVIFIGPCISKKDEAEQYGIIDYVLTFEELSEWFEAEGIAPESSANEPEGGKARLFPLTGGVLRSMRADNPDYIYLAIDGVQSCIAALDDIAKGNLKNCFIEMSACKGSCIGGPVMERKGIAHVRSYIAVEQAAGQADFLLDTEQKKLSSKNIPFQAVLKPRSGATAIEEVLRKMGKKKEVDELNCGSCGYNTCREKAAAILEGKADVSMCLPYLMERAQSFSDTIISNTPNGIIVLNDALEIQQINRAACGIMNIENPADVLNKQAVYIIDPGPFIDVANNHRNIYERRMYLAEYKRYVMLSVLYDKSFNIIISIMRDITQSEQERVAREAKNNKTIDITDRVIEKQMRTVQEIASLLGETTAETKIALTKLKETLLDE